MPADSGAKVAMPNRKADGKGCPVPQTGTGRYKFEYNRKAKEAAKTPALLRTAQPRRIVAEPHGR